MEYRSYILHISEHNTGSRSFKKKLSGTTTSRSLSMSSLYVPIHDRSSSPLSPSRPRPLRYPPFLFNRLSARREVRALRNALAAVVAVSPSYYRSSPPPRGTIYLYDVNASCGAAHMPHAEDASERRKKKGRIGRIYVELTQSLTVRFSYFTHALPSLCCVVD